MKITSLNNLATALASDLQIGPAIEGAQTPATDLPDTTTNSRSSQLVYVQSSVLPQQTYAQDGSVANYTTTGTTVAQSNDTIAASHENPYGDVPQTVTIGHSAKDVCSARRSCRIDVLYNDAYIGEVHSQAVATNRVGIVDTYDFGASSGGLSAYA